MKIAPKIKTTDPRTEPLPLLIDEHGLARQVADAPSADEAWRRLGLPGERGAVDPAVLARLLAASEALCKTSDAIGLGLRHFGERPADADPPPEWVERMVALHLEELEGYWGLDELAHAGLGGGWAIQQPGTELMVEDEAARIAARVRWQLEAVGPRGPALWLDRLLHGLDARTDPAEAKEAGRHLIRLATERHFTNWRTTRRTT